ncbi:hypothetical protein IscW_ISCW010704, partial [Ixodes scapularis]
LDRTSTHGLHRGRQVRPYCLVDVPGVLTLLLPALILFASFGIQKCVSQNKAYVTCRLLSTAKNKKKKKKKTSRIDFLCMFVGECCKTTTNQDPHFVRKLSLSL